MSEIYIYSGRVIDETEKGVLFVREPDQERMWFPKLQVVWTDDQIQVPAWLAEDKEWGGL